MFTSLKQIFSRSTSFLTEKFKELFSQHTFTQETKLKLEKMLLQADTGIPTTRRIIHALEKEYARIPHHDTFNLQKCLEKELLSFFPPQELKKTDIYLLVGINGSGKTTAAAKLAYALKHQGKTCLFIAADTFRAAAREQLSRWADRLEIPIVIGTDNQDPSSVVYRGCQEFMQKKVDTLIIDTAGRLQTKTNLMHELEKIRRTITKQAPGKTVATLLVIDAMLGQNSLEQARLFNESTKVDGIILTKLDGTGKAGIILSICHELSLPISYVSYGEQLEQFSPFQAQDFVKTLLGS